MNRLMLDSLKPFTWQDRLRVATQTEREILLRNYLDGETVEDARDRAHCTRYTEYCKATQQLDWS